MTSWSCGSGERTASTGNQTQKKKRRHMAQGPQDNPWLPPLAPRVPRGCMSRLQTTQTVVCHGRRRPQPWYVTITDDPNRGMSRLQTTETVVCHGYRRPQPWSVLVSGKQEGTTVMSRWIPPQARPELFPRVQEVQSHWFAKSVLMQPRFRRGQPWFRRGSSDRAFCAEWQARRAKRLAEQQRAALQHRWRSYCLSPWVVPKS